MRTFKKFLRKFLPRLGAVAAAGAIGLGAYASAVFFLYKPSNTGDIPFDTSARQQEEQVDKPQDTKEESL